MRINEFLVNYLILKLTKYKGIYNFSDSLNTIKPKSSAASEQNL